MIHGLRVQNFKSLKDIDVEFGGLTVLVGENNAGKSALLESIMYFKEGLENQVHGASDIPNKDYVGYDFSDPEVLFYQDNNTQAESVEIVPKFSLEFSNKWDELTSYWPERGVSEELPSQAWLGASMQSHSWQANYTGIRDDGTEIELCEHDVEHGTIVTKVTRTQQSASDTYLLNFRPNRKDDDKFLTALREVVQQNLSSLYYITDHRDIEDWEQDPKEHEFVGHWGENTVAWLHALRDEDEVFNRIVDAIESISSDIDEITADMYGSNTRAELRDMDTEELINVVASGAGIRRLLPIIVQIAAAEEGDTILLEEPELSVFGDAQGELLNFMSDAVENRDVQIIMSTHAHPILHKLDEMDHEDLGHVLFFEKEDGETEIEQYPFDLPSDIHSRLWGWQEVGG